MTLSLNLLITANCLIVLGALAVAKGHITSSQLGGINAAACVPAVTAAVVDGVTSVAAFFAGLGAVNAWIWWRGGGGDGTRRRLKKWARRFQGVRRTAPSHA